MLKISWSSLRTHETCKQRGFQNRQGRGGKLVDQRAFFAGNVTDRIVRNWLLNDPKDHLGEMPGMVSDQIGASQQEAADEGGVVRWRHASDQKEVEAQCRLAVERLEPVLMKLVVPYRYTPDFKFTAPLNLPHPMGGTEQVLIRGAMDILVQDDNDQFQIWDVKHTLDNNYWKKTASQLTFYDLAIRMLFNQKTTKAGLLQPLCDEPVRAFEISDEWRAQILQRVSGMASDIWRGDNAPRNDMNECHFCNVRHACSKFSPTMIDGKRRVSFLKTVA